MSYTAKELLKLASDFDNVATRALAVTAKKKEKKKPDPKDKLLNKDKKDKKSKKKKASEYYDGLLSKFAQGAVKDPAYAQNLTNGRIQSINAINIQQLTPEQVKEYTNGYLQQAFNDFQGNLITNEQYTQIVQAGDAKMKQSAPAPTATPTTAPASTSPAPTPAKPAGPAWKPLPKINSEVQRALNALGFQGKDFKPLDPDGTRGPNTDFALASFKNSSKWKNLLNIQPSATPEELSGLVLQAKQMKDAGTDKEAPTDFTKGPTMGQPPPTKWDPGF